MVFQCRRSRALGLRTCDLIAVCVIAVVWRCVFKAWPSAMHVCDCRLLCDLLASVYILLHATTFNARFHTVLRVVSCIDWLALSTSCQSDCKRCAALLALAHCAEGVVVTYCGAMRRASSRILHWTNSLTFMSPFT